MTIKMKMMIKRQASLDADYNNDEFNLDEQLSDSISDEKSSEQIIQKNIDNINLEYKFLQHNMMKLLKLKI